MIDFVGAGPGAKDLITVRGMELLKKADTVIYAGSLVDPGLLTYAGDGCKCYNSAKMTLEEVMEIMINDHRAGKNVVRLHTGDPALYGAIAEQIDILEKEGIEYGYCPGVSSLFGAASVIKKEFTVPGVSQSLIITRISGRTGVPETESLAGFAAHKASMALFLSAEHADKVSEELIKGGLDKDTPAAVVYRATRVDEKTVYTTVEKLPEAMKDSDIRSTAIIFTGDFLKGKGGRSKLYDPSFETGYRERKDHAV